MKSEISTSNETGKGTEYFSPDLLPNIPFKPRTGKYLPKYNNRKVLIRIIYFWCRFEFLGEDIIHSIEKNLWFLY